MSLSIHRYYSNLLKEIAEEEVNFRAESYILSVDTDEYCEYLFNKYALKLLERDPDRDVSIESIEVQGLDDYQSLVHIPIVQHDKIYKALDLTPSCSTLLPPRYKYNSLEGEIITKAGADPESIKRAISNIEEGILGRRNADIRQHNETLKDQIRQLVIRRKDKIKNKEELFNQIAKEIPVVLRKREQQAPTIFPQVKVKQKIKPVIPPKPSRPGELRLKREQFEAILALIDNTCRGFENTPKTFKKLGEEELRDVILSSLNGVFEGAAQGEAFSKLGKTDILVKIPKGGVFIAECKFWQGQKALQNTVSQILDYLTWRHSYGVLIIFSRNKGFTDVLKAVVEAIPSLPTYVGGLKEAKESQFQATHHLKEDKKKEIEIHYCVYNLYYEASR